jgi:uncharacterized protein YndB with AHSA1/START domain
MRQVWTSRSIDVPAALAWDLLVDLERWPAWGPSVIAAEGDAPLAEGSTGTITTAGGVRLSFEITTFEPGRRWAWTVAGVQATDHRVRPLSPDRCRVEFGVPWPGAPYLAVCRLALARIESLLTAPPAAGRP